jgi:hypothetical protein
MAYKIKNTKTAKRRANRTRKKKSLVKRKQNKKARNLLRLRLRKFSKSKAKTRKQYGGDFNQNELLQLKETLKNLQLTDKEISEMVEKLNLSSQQNAGDKFSGLIEQLTSGTFRNKNDIMTWILDIGNAFEEDVTTDDES